MSQIVKIKFTIEPEWTQDGLVIWCPTPAAQGFIARILDEKPLVVKIRRDLLKEEK